MLLACHRQSLQGRRFGGEQQAEALTAYRSAMLLEVVLSQCVQFIRSYYPTLEPASVTAQQLRANRQVSRHRALRQVSGVRRRFIHRPTDTLR